MRELIFYPAVKNQNGKFVPLLLNEKKKPQEIYWKSQSFIDIDGFTDIKPSIKQEDIKEEYRNDFSTYGENQELCLYAFNIEELEAMAEKGNLGLVEGYAPKEEAEIYYSLKERCEKQEYFHWEICNLLPAEYIINLSEKEKENYMKIAHLDTYSVAYTANMLREILDRITDYSKSTEENTYILVDYSF